MPQAVPDFSASGFIHVAECDNGSVSHEYPHYRSEFASIPSLQQYEVSGFILQTPDIARPKPTHTASAGPSGPAFSYEPSSPERDLSHLEVGDLANHHISESAPIKRQNDNAVLVTKAYDPSKPIQCFQHIIDFSQSSTNATPQTGSTPIHDDSEVYQPATTSAPDVTDQKDQTKTTDSAKCKKTQNRLAQRSFR